MIIKKETNLLDFEFWSGAELTARFFMETGLFKQLEEELEAEYPEGVDETELNDLFRFEEDYLAQLVGFDSYEALQDSIFSYCENDEKYEKITLTELLSYIDCGYKIEDNRVVVLDTALNKERCSENLEEFESDEDIIDYAIDNTNTFWSDYYILSGGDGIGNYLDDIGVCWSSWEELYERAKAIKEYGKENSTIDESALKMLFYLTHTDYITLK